MGEAGNIDTAHSPLWEEKQRDLCEQKLIQPVKGSWDIVDFMLFRNAKFDGNYRMQ